MVRSSRILRSFEWNTIEVWKTYLLVVRELYWPLAHFANAVTLAIFFMYQTESVLNAKLNIGNLKPLNSLLKEGDMEQLVFDNQSAQLYVDEEDSAENGLNHPDKLRVSL